MRPNVDFLIIHHNIQTLSFCLLFKTFNWVFVLTEMYRSKNHNFSSKWLMLDVGLISIPILSPSPSLTSNFLSQKIQILKDSWHQVLMSK